MLPYEVGKDEVLKSKKTLEDSLSLAVGAVFCRTPRFSLSSLAFSVTKINRCLCLGVES
jgi:hypothetical protein